MKTNIAITLLAVTCIILGCTNIVISKRIDKLERKIKRKQHIECKLESNGKLVKSFVCK